MTRFCMGCKKEIFDDNYFLCGESGLWHSEKKEGYLCLDCIEEIESYGSAIKLLYEQNIYNIQINRGFISIQDDSLDELMDSPISDVINELALNHHFTRIDPWRVNFHTDSNLLTRVLHIPVFSDTKLFNSLVTFDQILFSSFKEYKMLLIRITLRTSNSLYNNIEYYTLNSNKDLSLEVINRYQDLLGQMDIVVS